VPASGALTIVLATLSLRHLSPLYFLPLVALLVLLLERELIRASSGPGARAAIRILGVAALPLLVAFVMLVALRLNYIFGTS
jgi:uncharacterized membrane protein